MKGSQFVFHIVEIEKFGVRDNLLVFPRLYTSIVVAATVGVLNLRTVSDSSELDSFFLIKHIDAPESTANQAPLPFFWSGCWHYLRFSRSIKRSSVRILELVNIFRQIPCFSTGASFLVQGFLMWSSLNFGVQGQRFLKRTLLDDPSRWTLSFQNFEKDHVSLETLTACFDPKTPGWRNINRFSRIRILRCETQLQRVLQMSQRLPQHVGNGICHHAHNLFWTCNSDVWEGSRIYMTDVCRIWIGMEFHSSCLLLHPCEDL